MDPSPRGSVRPGASALLLASVVLGATDALIALAHGAGIAPERTLPLCLTAPLPIALLVLAPAALVSGIAVSRERGHAAAASRRTAFLVGVAGALAASHLAADRVLAAVTSPGAALDGAGARSVVLVLLGSVGFVTCRSVAAGCLARVPEPRLARLAVAALLLHAAALAGVVWQWRREGRGLERDLLSTFMRSAVPTSAAEGASRAAAELASAAVPENLVLVTIDTLRADHLDAARMPRTAALARAGVSATQAFAASPWTLPAVASLMTGLPAVRHGAGAALGTDPLSRAALDASHATLATVLRRAGFATRAVVTNPYLGLGYGLGRGFDAYENVTLESEAVLTLRPTVGFATLARLAPALAIADRGDTVTARAARFLRGRRDRRFFLWLHYVDPHAPYDGATRSFRDELLAGGGVTTRLPRMAQLRAGEIRPDAAGRAELRAAYARAVRFADEQIGRIVDLLDETGLADRTLLVVTADHGEELWDHGGVEHGHSLYDEVVRVPLVIRCPGCALRGARIDAPVAAAALAPTLLDLLGVPVEEDGDAGAVDALRAANGFAPLLRGERWTPSPIVSENLLFAEERIAVRTGRHTYVTWPNGKEELYDRARDPHELHDLAARSALVRRHRRILAAARSAEPGSSGGSRLADDLADGASAAERESARDAARLRRALSALGYVE